MIKLFVIPIDGYIRNDVLQKAQEILYHNAVCGPYSSDPTVVYYYNSEGFVCPIITNKQLPETVQDRLGNFLALFEYTGGETPTNPTVTSFEIIGYEFEVHVVGVIKGYSSDGTELYEV